MFLLLVNMLDAPPKKRVKKNTLFVNFVF